MNLNETQKVVLEHLKSIGYLHHLHDKELIKDNIHYQIRPDETFYLNKQVVLIEYEKNKRPVESISKYWWLFKNTTWSNYNLKTNLLITINKPEIEKKYKSRIESLQILGEELMNQYPNKFHFNFINYSDLCKDSVIAVLDKMIKIL